MSYQSIEIGGEESTPLNRTESSNQSGSWQKKVVVILGVVALVAVGAALMGSSVGGASQTAQDRSQLVAGTASNQQGVNLIGDAVQADGLPSSKCPNTQLCNDNCRATCPNGWVSCYISCLNSATCVGACPKQMVDLNQEGKKEASSNLAQADGAFPSACADTQGCYDACRATCPSGWVKCYTGCLNSKTCTKACPKMIAEPVKADRLPLSKCSNTQLCNDNCRATCPNNWVKCYIGCLDSVTCVGACPKQTAMEEEDDLTKSKKEVSSNLAQADGAFPSACPDTQGCYDACRATCPSGWVKCYTGCLNSKTCAKTCPKMIAEQSTANKEGATAAAVDGLPSTKCPDMLLCNNNCRATCSNDWVKCYISCLNSPTCVGACPKQIVGQEAKNIDGLAKNERESLRLAQQDGAFPSACSDTQGCYDTCRATCPNGWVKCYTGCLNSKTCAKACPKMIAEQLNAKEGDVLAAADKLPSTKCPEMLFCNATCRATCPNSWTKCYIGCLNSSTCQLPSCPKMMMTEEKEEYGDDDKKEGNL